LDLQVGKKNDFGKTRWDLMPLGPLEQICLAMMEGAAEYGPYNYRYIENWRRRYFAACCRHLFAWMRGEWIDPKSRLSHLAHAGACILILMENHEIRPND
jgi:hypothetical protein